MEMPGFLKGLFKPKDTTIVGKPIESSPPLTEVPPLPKPNIGGIDGSPSETLKVVQPGAAESLTGAANAAIAGKPAATEILATDAANKGIPVPDNLGAVAQNNADKIAAQNSAPAAPANPLGKTA